MSVKEIEQAINYGACLYFKGNTDRRIEAIKATTYGVGWFYNGEQQTSAPTLEKLVERENLNLDAWELLVNDLKS